MRNSISEESVSRVKLLLDEEVETILGILQHTGLDTKLMPREEFSRTPDKGYTGRAVYDVVSEKAGSKIGSGLLYVLLFQEDYATGDRKGENAKNWIQGLPEQWTPRFKKGAGELFISIGSIYNGDFFPGLTSLESITISRILGRDSYLFDPLTMKPLDYYHMLSRGPSENPIHYSQRVGLTYNAAVPFGNPHAVGFRNHSGTNSICQIGGFLEFPEANADFGKVVSTIERDRIIQK